MEILTTIPALFLDVKRYRINIWIVLLIFFSLIFVVAQSKNIFVIMSYMLLGLIGVWILSEKFYKWFSRSGSIYLTADEIIIEISSKAGGEIETRDSYKWNDIHRVVANNTANKIMAGLRLYFNDGTMVKYAFANQYYDARKASVGVDVPKFIKQYNIGRSEASVIELG